MNSHLARALVLVAFVAFPAVAMAAPVKDDGKATNPPSAKAPAPAGPSAAVVKIKPAKLKGGKARIMSVVPVNGTLRPFAPNQKVVVSFYLNGKRIERKTVRVRKGKRGAGVFRARIRIEQAGKYAVSARHEPTAALGGDSTVRKSWRVSFPAIPEGKCGPVVVGFKKAMRRLGYVANSGRCLGGKASRGVLAYRRVNGMAQNFHAGKGLVKRVFADRGAYRVRHPGTGRHVEASLSRQVLVFAKGDRPYAVYPISSGKSSTPTVTGHFTFQRTEPGYNSHGMYYSFYFYGGYAVHGYESVPDYPASHGCIRTFIADQPEIYERIEYGESIFVF
jgi:L,D-transpeptidase-like protein